MKRDFKFHYWYKGRRHESHIMADSYPEAVKMFKEYISFLRWMGLTDVSPERDSVRSIDNV